MNRRARILEISSYPPPHAGWGVRVQFLKRGLEAAGHECVVLNIGSTRRVPSPEYETVLGGRDYVQKVRRFCKQGFVPHVHVNGATIKGLQLTLAAQAIALLSGRRCFLTFHAGTDQVYFPRRKAPGLVPAYAAMFALSRKIICNSEEVKDRICEYGVPRSRVVPIPAFSTQYLESARAPLPPDLEQFYARWPVLLFCYLSFRTMFYPVELGQAFAQVAGARQDVGLVLCGAGGYMDEGLLPRVRQVVQEQRITERVFFAENLPHEQFLTALGRASFYLRSHVSDGVCSSVLESLSLGVPVVAAENGTRPPGVVTYPAREPDALAALLLDLIPRREAVAAALPRPVAANTLQDEIALLTT